MRKLHINHKKDFVKKEKKSKKAFFFTLVIAVLMISSIIGYMYVDNAASVEWYNDLKFTYNNNNWETKVDGKKLSGFNYFPKELDDITMDDAAKSMIKMQALMYTYDPNSTMLESVALANYLLAKHLYDNKGVYPTNGMLVENTYSMPIVTCTNATSYQPVILFEVSEETTIHTEGNCVIAKAKSGSDFIRLKDKLLYAAYGVI